MKRRQFIAGSCCIALEFSRNALAQRAMRYIGFLSSGSPNERAQMVDAFRKGLKEGGYIDGKDVAIEYRWAEGRYDRLAGLARELVKRDVAVIVASGGLVAAQAAKSETSAIPIVFTGGGADPVQLGLVASLSHPAGNVTGIANISGSLDAKRLEILRELIPGVTTIAYLANPKTAGAESFVRQVRAAGEALGIKIRVLNASQTDEIDAAFAAIKQASAKALLVSTDGMFLTQRDRIVALAARHAIPSCYAFREFTEAGGLVSYGADILDIYRQAGLYTAHILRGAKPSELPVIQATKFQLTINLKTAKRLGLVIQRNFLERVDEVME